MLQYHYKRFLLNLILIHGVTVYNYTNPEKNREIFYICSVNSFKFIISSTPENHLSKFDVGCLTVVYKWKPILVSGTKTSIILKKEVKVFGFTTQKTFSMLNVFGS